jgi:hypothetical protein
VREYYQKEISFKERGLAMETLPEKCMDINTVGSFCDCIAGEEAVDAAAEAFCSRTKNDKNITDEDLAELKIALMDMEDDSCCDC